MGKNYWLIFLFLIPHLLFSGGKKDNKTLENKNNNTPITVQNQNTYFTGDGAKGKCVAVLQPTGKSLTNNEMWLLTLIQGVLTSDFGKFSLMTIIDRQNLDKILAEQKLSLSGNYSDDEYIRIGHLTNTQYIVIGSLEKISNNNYILELAITHLESGIRKASFSPTNCTIDDIKNQSIIKKASEELLQQMGVSLTNTGKKLLYDIRTTTTNADISLSKGIISQRGGATIEPLSYYYEAISYDSSLQEATRRLSSLSSPIINGTLGESIRNDIERRKQWLALLTECENYFRNRFIFDIYYAPKLRHLSTNYERETCALFFFIQFQQNRIISEIELGLYKTGKKSEWGFDNWPNTAISIGGKPSMFGNHISNLNYTVTASIKNNQGNIFFSTTEQYVATRGWHSSTNGKPNLDIDKRPHIDMYDNAAFVFRNVPVKYVSDDISFEITKINGIDITSSGRSDYVKIYIDKGMDIKYDSYE